MECPPSSGCLLSFPLFQWPCAVSPVLFGRSVRAHRLRPSLPTLAVVPAALGDELGPLAFASDGPQYLFLVSWCRILLVMLVSGRPCSGFLQVLLCVRRSCRSCCCCSPSPSPWGCSGGQRPEATVQVSRSGSFWRLQGEPILVFSSLWSTRIPGLWPHLPSSGTISPRLSL